MCCKIKVSQCLGPYVFLIDGRARGGRAGGVGAGGHMGGPVGFVDPEFGMYVRTSVGQALD